jgi:NAD(P)-dependent dehydrogenase (short-subunit alcohol dehydrogenase family)
MDMTGKVAVVTGGTSGLGHACATLLSKKGVQVVVWDRQAPELNSANVLFCPCDVTNEASVQQALAETIKQKGIPRILIQCAGVLGAARMVGKSGVMPLDDFKKIIEINLIGTFNVMRLVAESMMSFPLLKDEEERGVVINTASIAAFEGQIGQTAYSASKGGVVAMTLPAARELAKQAIRVNTIAPGLMETPMLMGMPDEVKDNLKQGCVFPPRLGHPKEFAALVCHVIENTLINGEVIRLDGAIRLQAK